MNPKKVRKLRQRLEELRRGVGNMPSKKLERFAKSLERRRAKGGSEPTWVSNIFPDHRPISIPHHSRNLSKYVATNILDQFEIDIARLEMTIERSNGHE